MRKRIGFCFCFGRRHCRQFLDSNHVPAFYGARHNAGHTATVFHPGGGEFANVAANWLRWTFKGDKQAAVMFAGRKCGLCTNPNWDIRSKGFAE